MRAHACFAAVTLLAATSRAEPPKNLPAPTTASAAPDARGGRVFVAPAIAWSVPAGSAESGARQGDAAAAGPTYGGSVGLGLSRRLVLQATGSYSKLGTPDLCPACKATSLAVGLGVEYHLVDGTPFDPWAGFGVAYRSFAVDAGGQTTTWSGLDWARLSVGGDYWVARSVGFGPYLEWDLGRYLSRSNGTIDSGSTHSFLAAGARFVASF